MERESLEEKGKILALIYMKVQENAVVLQRSQLAACAWSSYPNQL